MKTQVVTQLRYVYMLSFIALGLWIVFLLNENAELESQIADKTQVYLEDGTYSKDGEIIVVDDPKYDVKVTGNTVTYTYEEIIDSKVRVYLNKVHVTRQTEIVVHNTTTNN